MRRADKQTALGPHGELWLGNGDSQMFLPALMPSSRVSLSLVGSVRDGSLAI